MSQHLAFKELRKTNYSLWLVLRDLRASSDADALLLEWRGAQEGTPEAHSARFYERAIGALSAAMGCTRREAEKAARSYIAGRR